MGARTNNYACQVPYLDPFFTCQEKSSASFFDNLLNLVEMNHQLACDPEADGCGKLNHIHHFLSTPPHVFMTGI